MSGRAARASKARKRERAAAWRQRCKVVRELNDVIVWVETKQAVFMSIGFKIMEEMERAHDPQR